MDEHHDFDIGEEGGKGTFLKVCMGLSLEVENEKVAKVAMDIFTAICEKDKDLLPYMRRSKCAASSLHLSLLLAVTANNCIIVVHGIQHLIVPLTHSHELKNQVLAFVNDEQGTMGFPTIVKLTKNEFEGVCSWPHLDIKEIMNEVIDSPQVLLLPMVADSVKTAQFIPITLFFWF